MKEILKEIFMDHGFERKRRDRFPDNDPIDGLDEIFVNEYDEMYFLVSGKLQGDTLNWLIDICAKAEKNEFYKRSWKSNWVILYMTELSGKLTKEQKNLIMQIEENKFFCRKYVFWYSKEEKEAIKELCENNFLKQTLHEKISSDKLFSEFKKGKNKGYECLARLYIKLPFLNLQQIPTTDCTIFTCVAAELRLIHDKVAELFENGEIDDILEQVELDEKESGALEQKVKAIEG